MKPVKITNLASDYSVCDAVVIEQYEFSKHTHFFTVSKDFFDSVEKSYDAYRAAYFIVRPKVTNHQSTIQL